MHNTLLFVDLLSDDGLTAFLGEALGVVVVHKAMEVVRAEDGTQETSLPSAAWGRLLSPLLTLVSLKLMSERKPLSVPTSSVFLRRRDHVEALPSSLSFLSRTFSELSLITLMS